MRTSLLYLAAALCGVVAGKAVKKTECGGRAFTYEKLAGFGEVPDDFRDKYGDTVSIGSSIALDESSWRVGKDGTYSGRMYTLPDRGWNTEGTTAYQPRLHIFDVSLKPGNPKPKGKQPYKNLKLHYRDTILFKDPSGKPIAGLDPTTVLKYDGFPDLPAAKYTGDGFGGKGPGGTRMSLDSEGLVLDMSQGYGGSVRGFWISDEYGPYIYHFDLSGKLDVAIRPPNAFIPLRNGTQSFASDNPPIYDPDFEIDPSDPSSGRTNNQGFEGLGYVAETNSLFALLQSALVQDGSDEGDSFTRNARLLRYSLKSPRKPQLTGEWVVPLPTYIDPSEKPKDQTQVAAQSEIHAIDATTFLVLTRSGGAGTGQDDTKGLYRHVDVFSLDGASDVLGKYDGYTDAVSPKGRLRSSIKPAKLCSWLDMDNAAQLARFGLVNGGKDNQAPGLLNEKWEGLALAPLKAKDATSENIKGKYFLFASSDNDFVTQDGYYDFGKDKYKDASGFRIQNQMLVFEVDIE